MIKVNGVSLEGMTLNEAVMKIRGPKGTKAKLEVVRPGHSEILHITVIRDEIPIETVDAQMMKGGIGKIEISQFAEDTAKDFAEALKKMEGQGMKGLIIDLRGNPGGLLPAVLEIAEDLVPGEKPIMFTEDKRGQRVEYKSKLKEPKPYPIVVLIDKGSASASEILAAALKESGGYTLVGQTTFGKGTVQTAKDFNDGSNLKLTMAKWLTPKGQLDRPEGRNEGDQTRCDRQTAGLCPGHPADAGETPEAGYGIDRGAKSAADPGRHGLSSGSNRRIFQRTDGTGRQGIPENQQTSGDRASGPKNRAEAAGRVSGVAARPRERHSAPGGHRCVEETNEVIPRTENPHTRQGVGVRLSDFHRSTPIRRNCSFRDQFSGLRAGSNQLAPSASHFFR